MCWEGGYRIVPRALCKASLAKSVSTRFNGRLCLQKSERSEEMAHYVMYKHEDLSSNLCPLYKILGIVVHTPVSPALQELKARMAVVCGLQCSPRSSGGTYCKLIRSRVIEKEQFPRHAGVCL